MTTLYRLSIIVILIGSAAGAAFLTRYERLASVRSSVVLEFRRDRWTQQVELYNPYKGAWMPYQLPQPTPTPAPFVPPPLDSLEPEVRPTPYFVVPRLIIQGNAQSFAYEDRDGRTITRPLRPGEKIPAKIRIP